MDFTITRMVHPLMVTIFPKFIVIRLSTCIDYGYQTFKIYIIIIVVLGTAPTDQHGSFIYGVWYASFKWPRHQINILVFVNPLGSAVIMLTLMFSIF